MIFSNPYSDPKSPIFKLRRLYHFALAWSANLIHGAPSRHVKIIAVTGTKGKSTTTELINAILEEAGYKTALSNTIRFKIADKNEPNLYKMSMPGRFFLQRFIRKAVRAGCDYVVMEMTSQGSLLHRHRFIHMDTLVVTNISPEHIEAHGSYENYVQAKLDIARHLERSLKRPRTLIVNTDDKEAGRFLGARHVHHKILFGVHEYEPYKIIADGTGGIDFTLSKKPVHSPLSGLFNLYNISAAIAVAKSEKISDDVIARAISKFDTVQGRVQKIEAGQPFTVIVDYAHTADSMEKLFQIYKDSPGKKICIFGATGGGRDTWKRPEMGRVADTYCDEIILTDDDSYDEETSKIANEIATGIHNHAPTIIPDRRAAIREGLSRALPGDVVLITGKGTDPFLMGPRGSKIPWSDEKVVREELRTILKTL